MSPSHRMVFSRYLRAVAWSFGRRPGCAAFMLAAGCPVLTIGKLGTSRGRLEYYDAQVAVGVEDYTPGAASPLAGGAAAVPRRLDWVRAPGCSARRS
jgi:hypothetical protein